MVSSVSQRHDQFWRSPSLLLIGLGMACIILIASISLGASDITPGQVWRALVAVLEDTLFAPIKLPRGLVTSTIGAPYFLYLMIQKHTS